MSDPRRDGAMAATPTPRWAAVRRWTLAGLLMTGAAGCSSSPQYPINLGEKPGDGSIIATQPQYPISADDAAQNAADRASQNSGGQNRGGQNGAYQNGAYQNGGYQNGGPRSGYPAYGAPPVAPPQSQAYGAPPAAGGPPPSDDPAYDAPRPRPDSSVDSSDLPPPPPPPSDAPPPPPQQVSFGGAQLVFGMDGAEPPPLQLAAYRHRRHHAAAAEQAAAEQAAADPAPVAASAKTADAKLERHGRRRHRHAAEATSVAAATTPTAPVTAEETAAPRHGRRRHGRAVPTEAADAQAASASPAAADTPYQTAVRPGEKLADVAARVHSSRDALTALNDLKHPRHVRAGTVLKIPYRYSYEVQKGDTLYTISRRFDQDPDAMARLNGLKHAAALQPGQTITLPTSAEDTGKRDHATADASPVAAPDKVADAALRKVERHGRRRRGVEPAASTLNAQLAAAEPSSLGRRRRNAQEAAPSPALAANVLRDTPTPPALAEVAPVRPPRSIATQSPPPTAPPPATASSPTQTARASSASAVEAPVGTQRYAGVRPAPTPPVTGVVAGYGYRAAEPPPPSAPARVATAAPSYAPSPRIAAAPTAPVYAAPRYGTPRSPPSSAYAAEAQGDARIASLTTPRYTPGLPLGGYAPSLGRERPVTPALPGGPLSSGDIASAGRGRFIWPLRGQLISGFGDKGTGQHNDGVDIAAVPGTEVRAAAAGEVVYAGSSIPGFGNLVLVKHAGGWVTAYAHLDRIEVRMRSTVAQGEDIGQAGQTGAVDRPQLHFEVRYAPDPAEKARPVDPTLVLPGG